MTNAGVYLIGSFGACNGPTASRGGACHNFIATLILKLFSVEIVGDFLDGPHCHGYHLSYVHKYTGVWDIPDPESFPLVDFPKDVPLVHFLPGHPDVNWESLEQSFPNFTFIGITVDESDLDHVVGNHFFKMHITNPDSHYIPLASGPLQSIPLDECKILINNSEERTFLEGGEKTPCMDVQNLPPNVYSIKFNDIIYNPDQVLETLSLATNKPVTPEIRAFYNEYIDGQRKLITECMPWIRVP